MRFFSLLALSLPTLALVPRLNKGDEDTSLLNFELSLEQLQNTFLEQGLRRFDDADFLRAGFPDFARGRFEEIHKQERVHAAFLSEAIRRAGTDRVKPCQYRFPLENPRAFVRASLDISSIVAASYSGALSLLDDDEYRVVDGSILSTESRHASWINSALFHKNPWNAAFDTALSPRQAWTAITHYIESCPPENDELVPSQSMKAFPRLGVISRLVPGQRGQVRFPGVEASEENQLFVIFKTGLQNFSAKLEHNGFFTVPEAVAKTGVNFIFITSNQGSIDDDDVVAGPTLYRFDFDSRDNTYLI